MAWHAHLALHYERQGARTVAIECDIADEAGCAVFVQTLEDKHGGVDFLVNNAGQARMSTFADTTDEAWQEELELKFFSQIYPVRAFKPLLDKSDSAAILAVNSLLAYQPEPYMVATSAARAGAYARATSTGACGGYANVSCGSSSLFCTSMS